MRFKLGGKDHFMTRQEFDCLYGFTQEGHMQVYQIGMVLIFGKKFVHLKLHTSPPVTPKLLT